MRRHLIQFTVFVLAIGSLLLYGATVVPSADAAPRLTPYERWAVDVCDRGVYTFHHPAKGTVVARPTRDWCRWTVLAATIEPGVRAGYATNPDLAKLIRLESSYRPGADNPTSTAYGLYQFLDSTWASYGCRRSSDPVYQSRCGIRYVQRRYGSPRAAMRHHRSHNWY